MSRNLSVQLTIAALLLAVLIATIINILQYNKIEKNVIETRAKVDELDTKLSGIQKAVEKGVRVQAAPVQAVVPKGSNEPPVNELLTPDPTPLVAQNAEMGGELKLTTRSDFKGYNRLIENSADVQNLYRLFVGNQLARRHYNDPESWHGQLAESVVPTEDYKIYHVKLRKGVMWHKPAVDFTNTRYKWLEKPRELVADDFVFMVEMIRDEKVEGAQSKRSYFEELDRIEVINDHEFKVHWKKKLFLSRTVVLSMLLPVPRWLYGADEDGKLYPKSIVGLKLNNHWFNGRGIGTGPYRFVESKPGEYLKLTRNDDYFEGRLAIKDITYLIIRDPGTQMLRFKKGEIDIMALSPTQYRKEILEADNASPFKSGLFKYDKIPRLAYRYLGWNSKSPLFEDKRVRRAMTHAFNRSKIVKDVFMDLGRIITGNFYIDTPWYDKSLQPYGFDLEAAGKLLDEAGWTDSDEDGVRDKIVGGSKVDFEFTLLIYNNFPEIKSTADIFKEDLIKIGVKMIITPVDWPAMQKKMESKDFQAYTGGWALSWDADPNQLWHSTQADKPKGSNFVSFKNPEADRYIDEAKVTFGVGPRQKLFHGFHKVVHEEQPYTFFYSPDMIIAYQAKLKNVAYQKPRPQVLYHLMWQQQQK